MSVRHPCVSQYCHLPIGPAVVCLHLGIYRYHVGCLFHHSSYCCLVQRTFPCMHIIINTSMGGTWGYQLTLLTLHIMFSHIGSYHSCCLCSLFHIAHDTVPTTSPPGMALCSSTSSMSITAMMVPDVASQPAGLGQQEVVLPSLLIPKDTRGVVGLTTVPQQLSQSQMPFQTYVTYAMGPPQVSFFSELSLPPICLHVLVAHYDICFLLSGSHVDAFFTYEGSTIGIVHSSPWKCTYGRHMCILVMVWGPCWVYIKWLPLHCLK